MKGCASGIQLPVSPEMCFKQVVLIADYGGFVEIVCVRHLS